MKKIALILLMASFSLTVMLSCKSTEKIETVALDKSKIIIDTIASINLDESRLISIYLPKGYTKEKTYPVVYTTDGQMIIDAYRTSLDSIIEKNIIPKFIFVGIHSNEEVAPSTDAPYRNYEYIKGWADEKDTLLTSRFSNHYKFFTEEVLSHVEKKYSVSKNRKDRTFYGVSNGAGFGVTLGSEKSEVFSNFVCFSMAGGDYETLKWPSSDYPFFHLSYGIKEPIPFIMASKEFDEFLTEHNYAHSLIPYDGGHDRKMWKDEFMKIISDILNTK